MSTGSIEEKIIQRQLSKEGLQSIVDNKEEVRGCVCCVCVCVRFIILPWHVTTFSISSIVNITFTITIFNLKIVYCSMLLLSLSSSPSSSFLLL